METNAGRNKLEDEYTNNLQPAKQISFEYKIRIQTNDA